MKHNRSTWFDAPFSEIAQRMFSLFLCMILLVGSLPLTGVTSAYADEAEETEEAAFSETDVETASTAEVVEGELIVVYEDEALALDEELCASDEVVESVLEDAGDDAATSEDASLTLEDLGVVDQELVSTATDEQGAVAVVELADDVSTEEAVELLEAVEGIAFVQPNYSYSVLTTSTDDPYAVSSSSGSTTAANQYYLFDSGTANAWDYVTSEGSVTIAVLDTGANLEHEDLVNTVDAVHAYDVTTDTLLAESDVANNGDAIGHGTMVAGVIAAEANNATGIAGASYNATVLPIKVFDEDGVCTTASLIAAYEYLDGLLDSGEVTNLKVINISLGYYASGDDDADEALHAAIVAMLEEHGVLTVAAGGNGSGSGSASTATCYPSDFDEVLSVTALDTDGTVASFSDYNAAKDLSAYGVSILTTAADGTYTFASGTSMAAPQVAAAAALLWAADPTLSASAVVALLTSTADEVSDQQADSGSAGALDVDGAVEQLLGVDDADEADATVESETTDDVDDESDDETDELLANSWRYVDGVPIYSSSSSSSSSVSILASDGSTWTYADGVWSTTYGGSLMTVTNAEYFGIDVSVWQGDIDWAAVKEAGVQFAIIRCGYGMDDSSFDDLYFIQNVEGCIENDIPFGIYLYSYAPNTTYASSEADHVLRLLEEAGLSPSDLSYPVYYDLEDSSLPYSSTTLMANIATTFCNKIEAAGYEVGIYASRSWFENYLTDSVFDNWSRWIAAYPSVGYENAATIYTGTYDIWQCMSKGSVDGIDGYVDINFDYYGYADSSITLGTVTAELSSDETTVHITASGGSFDTARTVKFPVWSATDGQDDIVWYTATKQDDGTWTADVSISAHGSTGTYYVHAYSYRTSGGLTGSTTFSVSAPSATVAVTASGAGYYTVTVSGITAPSGVSKVYVPTWTSSGGQDDIVWHAATKNSDGSYSYTVRYSSHNYETGTYLSHAYVYCANGTKGFVGAVTADMTAPAATITATVSSDETTVRITASGGAFEAATKVYFPTWSSTGGQDDIVWYKATQASDGSWYADVTVSSHASTGTYYVHAYATVSGTQSYVTYTTFSISAPSATKVSYVDNGNGTFTVTVSGVSSASGISKVQIPTWTSAGGQDDIVWYTATKVSSGTYSVTISASAHGSSEGPYVCHVYVKGKNGVQALVAYTTVNIDL